MLTPDDDLFDLPSVPRVRKPSASSNSSAGAGRAAATDNTSKGTRKNKRSRWSDAAPDHASSQANSSSPANKIVPNASSPTKEDRAVSSRTRMDRSMSPPPKNGKRRGRPRKVVDDDDDDDDDEDEEMEPVRREESPKIPRKRPSNSAPKRSRSKQTSKARGASPEIRPVIKKSRAGASKVKKSKSTRLRSKPKEEVPVEEEEKEEEEYMEDRPPSPVGSASSLGDADSYRSNDSTPSGGGGNGSAGGATARGGRLTSRQRAMQGEKVELEYGKLNSPRHKKKSMKTDELTVDEERDLKRQHKARLRQMVNEKKSKAKRAATVDKVLRGVTSKRKKICAANEAAAAHAADRVINKGVPAGCVRFCSGPTGTIVSVPPGEQLPELLTTVSKAQYPRKCTRDPATGKRIYV